jgi:hypothetical protein
MKEEKKITRLFTYLFLGSFNYKLSSANVTLNDKIIMNKEG